MNGENDAGEQQIVEQVTSKWTRLKGSLPGYAARIESRFLSLLRYTSLAIAALVLISAAIYLGLGLVQQIGSTNVGAESVALASEDITPPQAQAKAAEAKASPQAKPTVSDAARKRTLEIYRTRFKPFQRPDTKITDQEIVDYVWTVERLAAFEQLGGRLKDNEGNSLMDREAVITNALGLLEVAARTDDYRKKLSAFRDAKKINVCNDEVRTRSRTISSWDRYATYCPNWYSPPVGCASTSTIDEPYVEKVCEMKFPAELEAPSELFASSIQRYADTAEARLEAAANDAQSRSAQNMARKLEGRENMSTSVQLLLVFLAIMFLYLFVAIERHHRSLRKLVEKAKD